MRLRSSTRVVQDVSHHKILPLWWEILGRIPQRRTLQTWSTKSMPMVRKVLIFVIIILFVEKKHSTKHQNSDLIFVNKVGRIFVVGVKLTPHTKTVLDGVHQVYRGLYQVYNAKLWKILVDINKRTLDFLPARSISRSFLHYGNTS